MGEAVSIRKKVHALNMGDFVALNELEAKVTMRRSTKEKKVRPQPGGGSRGNVHEIKEILDARGSRVWVTGNTR